MSKDFSFDGKYRKLQVVGLEVIELALQAYNLYLFMERGVPKTVLYAQLSVSFVNAATVGIGILLPVTVRGVVIEEVLDILYVSMSIGR